MQTFLWGSDRPQRKSLIQCDLLVGALKDGRLLERVGLLLLYDAPLSQGRIENSLTEIQTSSHLNLFPSP